MVLLGRLGRIDGGYQVVSGLCRDLPEREAGHVPRMVRGGVGGGCPRRRVPGWEEVLHAQLKGLA